MKNLLIAESAMFRQGERTAGKVNSEGWLKELESAQWRGDREMSTRRADTSSSGNSGDWQTKASAKKQGQQSVVQDSLQQTGSILQRPSQAGSAASSRMATLSSEVVGQRENQVTPLSAFILRNESNAFVAQKDGIADGRNAYCREQWRAQNMHVEHSAGGVKIWLRDVQLATSDGLRILSELRTRLSCAGLRLAQFTLNGLQVPEVSKSVIGNDGFLRDLSEAVADDSTEIKNVQSRQPDSRK